MSRVTAPTDRNSTDPVLQRRALIEKWAALGKKIGYALVGVSCVAFLWGLVAGWTKLNTTIVIVSLGLSCVIMPFALVYAFGVRATNREERKAATALALAATERAKLL